jgi:PhnB protein
MAIEPYLNFDGRCEEAIEFYKKALGAEVTMLLRFKDYPSQGNEGCPTAPGSENKIMHCAMQIGGSTVMASDCEAKGRPAFQGISLSYSARDEAAANKVFNALADGGQVHVPLSKTFFSPSFGVVADRFAVPWMVVVPQK